MTEQRWMIVVGILLAVFLSYEAFAESRSGLENLAVSENSASVFSGQYQAGDNRVVFQSEQIAQDEILFSISINGEKRDARFFMDGRQLSKGNYSALTDAQQDLMFDAMNAVSDYYNDSSREVYSPALVLVSTMGYWANR